MARIKGWKRVKTQLKDAIRYDSTITNNSVIAQLIRLYDREPFWTVYTYSGYMNGGGDYFRTKAGAIKFAVNWMRRHPRG